MSRMHSASNHSPFAARGLTAAMVLILAVSAFLVSLGRPSPAEAHCDSVNGPVVKAARAALEGGDVRLILPYVHPEAEAELTAAFEQTMTVRALGGDAQVLADRSFFETAVRLHRAGEGAPYTGLKETTEPDAGLEAAETALESGSLDGIYQALDGTVRAGVQERYQAVLDARELEQREGTVEAARARAEAELQFEQYVYGISQAASGEAGHTEGAAPAESGGHAG